MPALRLAVHHAARAQIADEPLLQIVGRDVDLLLEVRQQVADADVDVLALREDVGVAVRAAVAVEHRQRVGLGRRAASATGVSSIMSSASFAGGQPGFMPRRRAITLLTPSAAMTIGARSSRPSRVRSVTPSASCARLRDRRRAPAARRPPRRASDDEQVIELDAADQEHGRPASTACGTRRPTGPRDTGSTPDGSESARAAPRSHGKPRQHAGADAAAARLLPRQRDSARPSSTRTPARARRSAAVAPGGPGARDDDVGVVIVAHARLTGCRRPRWSLLLRTSCPPFASA